MILYAWTAIFSIVAGLGLVLVLGLGVAASLLTSGRMRIAIQGLLALVGLALTLLFS